MSGRAKYFLAALAALLALGLYLAFGPSGGDKAVPLVKAVPAGAPAQELQGVRLEGSAGDGARWQLYAQSASADEKGELGSLNEVRAEYSGKAGIVSATAKRAERAATGGYLFTGGVLVSNGEWTARTESLSYDPLKGVVSTDLPVTVESARALISGRGFTADLNTSVAVILKESHAVLKGAGK